MTSQPLDVWGSATADGTGRAVVRLGPVPPWQRWTVTSVVVSSTPSGTPRPTCTVYNSTEAPSRQLARTLRGDGDSTAGSDTFQPNEQLVVVWEGCTVGASCTAVAYGTRELPA